MVKQASASDARDVQCPHCRHTFSPSGGKYSDDVWLGRTPRSPLQRDVVPMVGMVAGAAAGAFFAYPTISSLATRVAPGRPAAQLMLITPVLALTAAACGGAGHSVLPGGMLLGESVYHWTARASTRAAGAAVEAVDKARREKA